MKNPTITFTTILVVLACCTLSPAAQAVTPAPDGGYPNQNTAEGDNALLNLATGTDNTALGFDALATNTSGTNNTAVGSLALVSNTMGFNNTAIGQSALENDMTGDANTATGVLALGSNTTGFFNTANGYLALYRNNGSDNTAIGHSTLYNNTGDNNTATGAVALGGNTTASNNTADGYSALLENTTGTQNTATGAFALELNTTANNNTADGFQALLKNTTGAQNTATGESALKNNTTASNNTADGFQALFHNTTGVKNTAVGQHALFNNTGSSNIAVGANAGGNLTIGSNNIDIGNPGVAAESNTIRIGGVQTMTFIKGISGVAIAGAPVVVNAGGQLGVAASSERFKDKIRRMDKASEAILRLKPVSFRYKKEIDPHAQAQFGLVAEEVAEVSPDLVVRDEKGEIYTVRYEAVNAMLLNEFLKEHKAFVEQRRKLEQQEATVAELKSMVGQQQLAIETLTAGLQSVNAQVGGTKATANVVLNHR